MPVNDQLGLRMKENYEKRSRTQLLRRVPVALRIDGKAFHTFTKHLKKPFDTILIQSMQETMKFLCENIQGCVLGYTQSDEITLILIDYQTFTTEAWFDYQVQKMCSVAASMATLEFNRKFEAHSSWYKDHAVFDQEYKEYVKALCGCCTQGAMFDCRAFNIPKEEATNLIYWRQLDATRNSIEMVGHAYFSTKQLHKKSCNDIQDMLFKQFGINWNDFPTEQKRGSACIKTEEGWMVDHNMPILKGDDREYVERLIRVEQD